MAFQHYPWNLCCSTMIVPHHHFLTILEHAWTTAIVMTRLLLGLMFQYNTPCVWSKMVKPGTHLPSNQRLIERLEGSGIWGRRWVIKKFERQCWNERSPVPPALLADLNVWVNSFKHNWMMGGKVKLWWIWSRSASEKFGSLQKQMWDRIPSQLLVKGQTKRTTDKLLEFFSEM